MSLLETKSLLAKLMATEDLRIQQDRVQTASFNIETRVLTVPILDNKISKDVYDLFMGHEVGHALYTPYDGMKKAIADKINMNVVNIVEDSRIERKIKNKYPGIKAPFFRAYDELYEKNFFGTEGKDLNAYNFVDRINLHCKIGAGLTIKFSDKERELLAEVESTETYDDVIEVTKKICDFMNMEDEEEVKTLTVAVLTDDDGDGTDENESEGEQPADITVDARQGEGGDSSGDSEENEGEEEKQTKDEVGGSVGTQGAGRKEKHEKPPEPIRSFTDEAYKENEQKLFDKGQSKYVYVNVPEYDIKRGVVDYKTLYLKCETEGFTINRQDFINYRRESAKVVSYLVKEFELRKNADQMKRASTAKTGDLDLSKIYSFNFNEDLFKKITVVPHGQSHGLVMFLDWSGSMSRHIGNTVKQLLNLVMFCKKVNIPYEVYCFIESSDREFLYKPAAKLGDVYCGEFGMVNLLSSRMTANEFITGAAAMMKFGGITKECLGRSLTPWFLRMSGTPLNECVIAAMEIVPDFQKKNRLQIVNTVFLTDGEGSCLFDMYDSSSYPTKAAFTHMVIRDPKTRNEEVFERNRKANLYYSSMLMAQTDCFIRLLKKRTNSHVIGFFVCESKDISNRFTYFYPDEKDDVVIKEKFRKENYAVVTSTGFDDYYLLRSNGLDTDDEEELEFKENATTRGMVSAFSRYTANKITSRVVLNRFIGLIS